MNDATFTWELPTTRDSGRSLDVSEIAFAEIALSGDGGATFSVLGNIVPPDLDLVQVDLADGDYIGRCVIVDTQGNRSDEAAPEALQAFAVDTSGPGLPVNFQVTLS